MGRFGEELRKERESRGIALETISEKTKVVTRYLSALEDDHFEVLPGGILSKGIVRGYVRTVGLDETDWMQRFLAASQKPEPAGADDGWVEFVNNVGRTRARSGERPEMRLRWAGIAVLLLLLAGFGWCVWSYVNGRSIAAEAQRQPMTSAAMVTGANANP